MRIKITERRSAIAAKLGNLELQPTPPTSPQILTDSNAQSTEIDDPHHCKDEMDEMLAVIEHQSTFSLNIMGRRLAAYGQCLDKVFMRYFLVATMKRYV